MYAFLQRRVRGAGRISNTRIKGERRKMRKKQKQMSRKILLTAALGFLLLATMGMQNVLPMRAEDSTMESSVLPGEYSPPKWFVDANGTVFQITKSSYLNVTLTSSEYVHVLLESVPRVVSYSIESLSSANSTVLTLSGFVPSTTYYRHQDGYLIEEFTTDSNGGYTYAQEISVPHHVYIQEHSSTLYISSDYTFTGDIYENIVVKADNIVINGNGYTLQAPAPEWGYGFDLSGRSGVTIKNVIVKGWTYGIWLWGSSGNTLSGNNITDNVTTDSNVYAVGIFLRRSSSNTISGNNIAKNQYGIWLWGSSNTNAISGNNIASNEFGIYLYRSSNTNAISGNAITNNGLGIGLDRSGGNVLKNNIMTGNSYCFGVEGLLLSDFINDVDTSNTVDGKPIYYWINRQNEEVPSDAGYVGLVNSINITVKGLELENEVQGILLAYTTESEITDNTITNNEGGIYLVWSSGNTISGNTITSNIIINAEPRGIYLAQSSGNTLSGNSITYNYYGIYLVGCNGNTFSDNNITTNWFGFWLVASSGNTFYHNNIGNPGLYDQTGANYWYNPNLLEGNYWSNYPGVDDGSGTGKHAIAGDGIGDTIIPWPGPNFDYYPFTHPSGWCVRSVYVDIKPGSWPNPINLASRGVLPVAICGTADFDVRTIDVTTIKLTREGLDYGVSPIRCDYEDAATPWTGEPGGGHALGGDGYLDLTLKFSKQEVIATLGLDAFLGQKIPLIITGNLNDAAGGTAFTGQDYVWILNLRGDANDDMVVNVLDVSGISAHWYPGPPEGPLGYDEVSDFNFDGAVDVIDLAIVSANWEQIWQP